MKTKRISNAMETALNEQMNREAYQAQVYLAYASWAEVNGFPGISDFLYGHMEEERKHMFKFLKYINDRGGHARVTAIDAPPSDPKDMGDCLRKALEHEIDNSQKIDEIVHLAHEERDWATFNFGQWFVKEQIEEETLVNDLLDKYNLATGHADGHGQIYEFDRDAASSPQEATLPREEEF
ncbi:ferritin [Allorhodopirellula heiligendammensis]|uniref:Ferritin n=1 Tax=Allorhodopirellula heiligendammensis TaxID=2714739 RepID=A0A5C6C7I0_9BACT|nr:ferritin [Allorhodopirellula heiligendammensis]TWU19386.1 putative ferritin-1 [Allorhodopirellula heiligendammensis]